MYRSQEFPILPIFLLTISTTVTSFPQEEFSSLLPTHLVYQFPNAAWVENLVVRSNGDILVTLLSTPDLYLIGTSQPSATLVHSFPSVLGLTGIAELEHDIFYIAAGKTSFSQSCSVWEVDMRSFPHSGAWVRKVADMPEAVLLNGMVILSKADKTILIADSTLGTAWRLNVQTGTYSIAISDPTMAPVDSAPNLIGINGVKIRDGHLYFTNSNQGIICSVPISTSGTATGDVKVLATGIGSPDDFALDGEGRAWIAQNSANVVSVLFGNGTMVYVAGAVDQLTVAGVSSCVFGRARGGELFGAMKAEGHYWGGEALLYCCTSGGQAKPVNGTVMEGGKVVVIDTSTCPGTAVAASSCKSMELQHTGK